MIDQLYLTMGQLLAGLENIRQSPRDRGALDLIVRRPGADDREMLAAGELDVQAGLVGDNWKARGSSRMPNGSAHPDMQLTIMNSRVIDLLAQTRERWGLAGDQLYVDLDISSDNLPPGARLAIGSAIVEVTAQPHTGCRKFAARFGQDALKFVNSEEGKALRLRGVNARIVKAGVIHLGDVIGKL